MSPNPIEKFIEDLNTQEVTDLVLMVASLDPTEQAEGGKARWNGEQRELITTASHAADEAGLSD